MPIGKIDPALAEVEAFDKNLGLSLDKGSIEPSETINQNKSSYVGYTNISMDSRMEDLATMVDYFGVMPTIDEMVRRDLPEKGIYGPTAAHVIEEVHVPLNLAYVTFTTGSSSFQNVVGVTHQEIDSRILATHRALQMAGVKPGAKAVISYAPLVNVFPAAALRKYGLTWSFPKRSSRDALILSLVTNRPDILFGESRFLRATVIDSERLGYADLLPRDLTVFCAGTTLDLEFLPVAEKYGWKLHDLYGCQEFGWLTLDGRPLRDDLVFAPSPVGSEYREVVVGGLPMADSCPFSASGHTLDSRGSLITYRRRRTNPEYEVLVAATTVSNQGSLERITRSILRTKARIFKIKPDAVYGATETVLELVSGDINLTGEPVKPVITLTGPKETGFFDLMVQAQREYQENSKTDPTWIKGRN
ncbi:MAG: acyl carrier protein [Deltaproteobacteria bacterium]|jgi:hypothetical protein|nr:acyl carrier protein [Deltaproteobacteria bacterium]